MEVKFRDSFNRDIKTLDKKLKSKIESVIINAENAEKITQLGNLKKLKGHPTAYRLRIGDYRIGLFIKGNVIEFTRCLHRRDMYRYFP